MAKRIPTSDPIFARLSLSSALLDDVVDLVDRSQSLPGEIDQRDATALPGGNTAYHVPVINIAVLVSQDDMTAAYGGGSLAAGRTEGLTSAGQVNGAG